MEREFKIGDLVECDDTLGLVASHPYDIYDGQVRVVDVIWAAKARSSRVDHSAFLNGTIKAVK